MNWLKSHWVLILVLFSGVALAAGFERISKDTLILGTGSSADKVIEFDQDQGGSNGKITVDSNQKFNFSTALNAPTIESATVTGPTITDGTITDADFDGNVATNTSRLTVPKADTSSINGLTRKEGTIFYDTTLKTLKVDDGTVLNSVGSGGGGGSLVWNEPDGSAPIKSEENGGLVYLFEVDGGNTLVAFLKIPASHVTGNPITMNIGLYSPSTSNTILLSALTTLIRTGTDGVDDVTNQHASTNTALTNTVANLFRSTTLDLSDGSGQINSVDAEAGDLLIVVLSRGSDTDTADIRFVPNATEVAF